MAEEIDPDVRLPCVLCHKRKPLDDMQLRRGTGYICLQCWLDNVRPASEGHF